MKYDLEPRTELFASDVRNFVRKLPKTISNVEDVKQLIRSSASVAANYIEANEAISKKDFYHRIKICRKESKESGLFLRLLFLSEDKLLESERNRLNDEARSFVLIFQKILSSSKE